MQLVKARPKLTYVQAAKAVLQDSNVPLTVASIVQRAIAAGYLIPSGKTPVATMSSVLYVDCTRNPHTEFSKVFTPGDQRATRGTVKWALKSNPTTALGPALG
jgi:HB1, ASXL, restriction endonuclease HTH domain